MRDRDYYREGDLSGLHVVLLWIGAFVVGTAVAVAIIAVWWCQL